MTTRFQAPPFVPLTPEEELFERHRCRFLKVPFEPEVTHRWRCWAAFKRWEWDLRRKAEAIEGTSAAGASTGFLYPTHVGSWPIADARFPAAPT